MFQRGDYTDEDVILWHQRQLSTIAQPLRTTLPFDQSDRAAVLSLRGDIGSLLGALDEARTTARAREMRVNALSAELVSTRDSYEERIAALAREQRDQLEHLQTLSEDEIAQVRRQSREQLDSLTEEYQAQLSTEAMAAAEAARHREQEEQRFRDLDALFRPDEATVSRQGDDVRIDASGFSFPPGGAEIGANNFGVLDRILTAVDMFPDARIQVIGHTDSTGSESRNLTLSIERANNVARFLTQVGGVPAARVESTGYGETRPIASNDSPEGRAKNRRIEILLLGANAP
jgi:outer membrane protein OmpA-like peptidoglycan-associated protein